MTLSQNSELDYHDVYPWIRDQNEVDKQLDLTKYRKCGDPWKSKNFETFNNHIRALYSLKQVTELMLSKNICYDRIIFCRPDVKFTKSLNIDYFYQSDNNIILPNFHNYPINDRFAICSVENGKKYGLRFYDAFKYSLKKRLHSETFLNFILSKNKINICKRIIRFKRVRCDGKEID